MNNLVSRRDAAKKIVAAGAAGVAFAALGQADQPNMENALASLKSARESLVIAKANKGGHRANAIKLIDQAIDEVKQGIAAGV